MRQNTSRNPNPNFQLKSSPVLKLIQMFNQPPKEPPKSTIRGFTKQELQSLRERSMSRPITSEPRNAALNPKAIIIKPPLWESLLKNSTHINFNLLHKEVQKTRRKRIHRMISMDQLCRD